MSKYWKYFKTLVKHLNNYSGLLSVVSSVNDEMAFEIVFKGSV